MSEKNVEEVKSLLKEIKSKFFESYVDYLFDDEKCNFYWNQLEEELHTGLINVINSIRIFFIKLFLLVLKIFTSLFLHNHKTLFVYKKYYFL